MSFFWYLKSSFLCRTSIPVCSQISRNASRRWRTRCSFPIARASPQMNSRTSIHRPISLFCDPIHRPFLSSTEKALRIRRRILGVSNESNNRVTRSMFQWRETSLSLSLFLSGLPTYISADTHTKFSPFFISFVAPHAWRGCNLHSLVFETGIHACFRRRGECKCVLAYSLSFVLLYVWVCIMNVCVRVTLAIFVFVPYPVEQRRWDPTSDRWYNWTGRTIHTGQFAGITFLKPLCLNSSRQLYSCAAEQRISCASRNSDEFDTFWKIIYSW